MAGRDIIVIGASAGGVEALRRLVAELPSDIPASIFVVLHFPSFSVSVLPKILSRHGPVCAVQPEDGQPIEQAKIYVARPDYHMLIGDGVIRMTQGPRENHTRPAIDPLFRSAASSYGDRVVGIILSGTLFDGTAGLAAVKKAGGYAIVEDPSDAAYESMPRNAIANVDVDDILPLSDIAPAIDRLARGEYISRRKPVGLLSRVPLLEETKSMSRKRFVDDSSTISVELAESSESIEAVNRDRKDQIVGKRNGVPSIYTCPECSGTLWQIDESTVIRFRCHEGHAYLAEDLLGEQGKTFEKSMWYAIRTLIDKSNLSHQLAEKARSRGHLDSAAQFDESADTAKYHAETLRQLIYSPSETNIAE